MHKRGKKESSGRVKLVQTSERVNGKVYKMVERSDMMYGLEIVALTKSHEVELEVAELKILRFLLGMNRIYRIRH